MEKGQQIAIEIRAFNKGIYIHWGLWYQWECSKVQGIYVSGLLDLTEVTNISKVLFTKVSMQQVQQISL